MQFLYSGYNYEGQLTDYRKFITITVKLRLEAGYRLPIHAGSRLEAGSISSFKYAQTPNTLLTLRLTRLSVRSN